MLTTEQFWRLTPRQFKALERRMTQEHIRQEQMFAVLDSLVVNFSMGHPDPPAKPADFMPSLRKTKQQHEQEELEALAMALMAPKYI